MTHVSAAEKNLRYFTLERRALGALIVSGLFLWSLFFAGLFDFYSPVFDVLWGAHLVCHIAALAFVFYLFAAFLREIPRKIRAIYLLTFALSAFLVCVLAMLPIVSRDALLYHLAVPKLWLEAGRIVEISWHEWSHFPLMISLAYAGFLKYGLVSLTPYYHLSYLLLLCGVVAAFVYYKFQQEELAILSALLAFTLPVCMRVGIEPMSDLALAFYFGLSFAVFIFWGEQRGSRKLLLVVGLFLGFALCTKYNAILACAMFCLCMLSFLQRWDYSLPQLSKTIALIFLIALLIFLPWPIKNYIHTGNPLYPFAGGVFGVSDEMPFMGGVSPINYRLMGYEEKWWQLLLIPLRMLFTGEDDNARQFDGVLSPILLISLLAIFIRQKEGRRPPWILNSALFIASYFFLSLNLFYALLRYQGPSLMPMMALTSAGIYIAIEWRDGKYRSLILRTVLASHVLWVSVYSYGWLNRTQAANYFLRAQVDDEYLTQRLDEYETIQYVNASLPADASLYLLFTGNRFFYYERKVRGAYFSQAPIVTWLKENPSADSLAEKFQRIGVTHLAIQNRRTRSSFDQSLNEAEKAAWTEFVAKHLELLHQGQQGQSVWRLR